MATVKVIQDFGRQYPLAAVQKITYEDANDGTLDACVIDVPEDAFILSAALVVTTAFNSGTSDVIEIGYAADPNFYLTSTSIAATGRTSFIAAGLAAITTATNTPITLNWTGVGAAPTTGEAYVVVEYVVKGRANENQD